MADGDRFASFRRKRQYPGHGAQGVCLGGVGTLPLPPFAWHLSRSDKPQETRSAQGPALRQCWTEGNAEAERPPSASQPAPSAPDPKIAGGPHTVT
jgi:hypothetical protein